MFLFKALKKPLVSIFLIVSFIMYFNFQKDLALTRFKDSETSCQKVVGQLSKSLPAHWKADCQERAIRLFLKLPGPMAAKAPREKSFYYRILAKYLVFISSISPEEDLKKVYDVRISFDTPNLLISAETEGRYLSQFAHFKENWLLDKHLRATVLVKETVKK